MCKTIIVILLSEPLLIAFFCTESVKVFLSWREATTRAVSQRRQQEEAVSRAQRSINQGNNITPYNDHMQ